MTLNALTPRAATLDDLGVDRKLQTEFREVIEEISNNVSVALQHSAEWDTTTDFLPAEPARFFAELGEAYPIFTVVGDSMKMSFVSRNDGKYWQFSVTKTAFLHIRQDPQSFPSANEA